MKQLKEYIQEKLHVGKYQNKYNPDDLNGDNELIYSDMDDEDTEADSYNDFIDTIDRLNKNYIGFIVCRFDSLSKIQGNTKLYEKTINDYSDDLTEIKDRIITGKDLGYEVRLSHGHLEFDCVNSGSRATYYVYALEGAAYNDIEEWFNGDLENDKLDFLYKEGNILAIEL